MTHLLVTNDFPPKVGGIQAYLWELWSRLDPDSFVVLTASSHRDAAAFDRAQAERGIRIERVPGRVLAPTPRLVRRIRETAGRVGAGLVVVDPVFPLGLLGPRLDLPYAVLLHGAEVAVPGRLPVSRQLVGHVIRHSVLAISAGGYPAAEAARALRRGGMPPVVEIPPGVDLRRFRPLTPAERAEARADLGLPADGPLVVSVSRLVPRKGMDVLIDAAVRLRADRPDLTVAIAGRGRDSDRLAGRIAEYSAPVRLLGGVSDADLPRLVGRRRRLRHGVPQPVAGPGAGGVRHRLPRGRRGRRAPGGRPVRWRRRGRRVRDHRDGGPPVHRCGCGGPGHRRPPGRSRTSGRGWARHPGGGSRHPSTMTNSPLGWPRRSPTWKAEGPPGHGAGR